MNIDFIIHDINKTGPMNKIIQGSGLCFKEDAPADVEAMGKHVLKVVELKYTNHVIAQELFKISEGLVGRRA